MCIRDRDVTYRNLYSNYSLLPNISFDYQVVEKAEKVFVVPFNGCWKDLGTWNSLSEQMETDGSVSYTHLDVYKRQGYRGSKEWYEKIRQL